MDWEINIFFSIALNLKGQSDLQVTRGRHVRWIIAEFIWPTVQIRNYFKSCETCEFCGTASSFSLVEFSLLFGILCVSMRINIF